MSKSAYHGVSRRNAKTFLSKDILTPEIQNNVRIVNKAAAHMILRVFPGFRWSAFNVASGEPSTYNCIRGAGNVVVLHIPKRKLVECPHEGSADRSGETKQPEHSPCLFSMTSDGLPRVDKLKIHNIDHYYTIKLYLEKQTMGLDGVELDFLRDLGLGRIFLPGNWLRESSRIAGTFVCVFIVVVSKEVSSANRI